MTIIKNKSTLTAKEAYRLTHAAETEKVIDLAGDEPILVNKWAICNDIDRSTGEEKMVVFIEHAGMIFASASPTFVESFGDIVDMFGDDFESIYVKTGTSKSNRVFVYCELADI